ncbi:M48 family metalloprotease [Hydrogenophaga sp.]|uniref:M48 family metalloprotease n=1 Tax=Hydrogenophaga sp. TaxID=1904254 RepID=UPI003F6E4530
MNGISRFFCLVLGGALLASAALAQEACLRDPARAHELRVLDEAQVIDLMDQYPVVAAPARLHRLMAGLIAASPRLRAGPSIHLLAYEDGELNAYGADHGLVILTSAMWSAKENLSDDELAAVIAHELAHIEGHDSLVEACANLQRLAQPALRIEDARDRMALEMFNPHSPLARAARQELHAQEHAADVRGIELLRAVGRDPMAMVSVLAKIHGTEASGLNLLMGSSHPDVRERLARARRAAAHAPGPVPHD